MIRAYRRWRALRWVQRYLETDEQISPEDAARLLKIAIVYRELRGMPSDYLQAVLVDLEA